jgi:hypothetical protein
LTRSRKVLGLRGKKGETSSLIRSISKTKQPSVIVSASPKAFAGGVQLYLASTTPAASSIKGMAPACLRDLDQEFGADKEAEPTVGSLLRASVLHRGIERVWLSGGWRGRGRLRMVGRLSNRRLGGHRGSMMRCGKHRLDTGDYRMCGTSAWFVLRRVRLPSTYHLTSNPSILRFIPVPQH